jgi:hypothetical protein
VDAVSGSGSFTYLGATDQTVKQQQQQQQQRAIYGEMGSPSLNSTSMSTTTLHNNNNTTISTTTTTTTPEMDNSVILGNTIRSINSLEDYQTRINSGDAISVGSNDSGEKHSKDGKLFIKGHKFIDIKYRMPTYCDACSKPLWDLFNPPAAIECLSCHTKIHQEHYTNEKDSFQPCLLNDENVSARDLLLLCSTPAEQQIWIEKIRKYIPKKIAHHSNHSHSYHSISSQKLLH